MEDNFKIEVYRTTKLAGQTCTLEDSAIKLTDIESGIYVIECSGRSQIANLQIAKEKLRKKLRGENEK